MGVPANLRVNTSAPFPSLVKGAGPISVSKSNGIWTITFSVAQIGVQNPPVANFPTDQALVWDSVADTFILVPLSVIGAAGRTQRSITTAGNLPIVSTDSILNVNAVSDLIPIVPSYLTRRGAPLTFKILPGSHLQTLTATAPDTFDGEATVPLAAGAAVTLVPYNDGVNAGYAIE